LFQLPTYLKVTNNNTGYGPLRLLAFRLVNINNTYSDGVEKRGLDKKILTLLHIIRIPVELGLYWLFIYKAIPQLMTFEGRNFDILVGLTVPFDLLLWLC
jgi:hypothetical protein